MSIEIELKEPQPVDDRFQRFEDALRKLKRKVMDLEELFDELKPNIVYSCNITVNWAAMAEAIGIYMPLCRPDELGITQAKELIEPFKKGLGLLKSDPKRFKKLNPEHNIGSFDDFVVTLTKYIQACEEYPEAIIEVSR